MKLLNQILMWLNGTTAAPMFTEAEDEDYAKFVYESMPADIEE